MFFASTGFPIVEIKAAPPHTPAELPAAIGKVRVKVLTG